MPRRPTAQARLKILRAAARPSRLDGGLLQVSTTASFHGGRALSQPLLLPHPCIPKYPLLFIHDCHALLYLQVHGHHHDSQGGRELRWIGSVGQGRARAA